jgi:hypothetical protein
MISLELKSMEESIIEIVKSLKDTSTITEAEKGFYKQWRDLGCRLFENHMQEEIRTYEKTLSSPKQRWSRNYQTRFGTIRLERRAYRSPEGLSCPADRDLSSILCPIGKNFFWRSQGVSRRIAQVNIARSANLWALP